MERRPGLPYSPSISAIAVCAALVLLVSPLSALQQLIIAIAPSVTSTLDVVAEQKGFFAKEGLAVKLVDAGSGVASINMMLSGEADIAEATVFPLVSATFDRRDIKIFATTNVSGNDNVVVARRDRGIVSVRDLRGKKIGALAGGLPEYVLDLMLLEAGVSKSEVEIRKADLPSLLQQFADGKLDALCCFGAWVDRAIRAWPASTIVLSDESLVRIATALASTSETLEKGPELFAHLLQAYIAAEDYVAKHPEEALNAVISRFKLDPATARAAWKPGLFRLRLDQSMIREMENIAQWQIGEGTRKNSAMPDVLDLFEFGPLQRIDPRRVTIIH